MDNIEKLIERLKIKYPSKYISINKEYDSHILLDKRADTTMFYRLYVADTFGTPSTGVSFKMLNAIVDDLVIDPKNTLPECYYCETGGMDYGYMVDPEDGSIDLEGGVPIDEMEIMQVKADCLADYEKRIAEKVENHAENLGQDVELRRLG